MGFVIEGFIGIGLICLLVWGLTYYLAAKKDLAEARDQKAQATEEAKLHAPGEQLHCLGCSTSFAGPLPETGCPNCHTSSLVITESQYQNTLKNSL